MKPPRALTELIDASPSILLATHIPMDGDGLGCGIALLRALGERGHQVRFLNEAPVPPVYEFLDGFDRVEHLASDGAVPDCDLLLGLDAGDEHRLGRLFTERPEGCKVANVDHHATNDRYGDVAWVEAHASSTGEMVHALLTAMGAEIDPTSAQALLVSLVTDTGRFSYSSTTAGCFEAAADLVRRGANPDAIYQPLYASMPRDVLRLRSRAGESVELLAGGRAALLTIEADYGGDLSIEEEDLKNLVDIGIALAGVQVAALVRGLPQNGTKVSLRSKSDAANVAELARRHGGGGHVRAAGFSADAPPREVAAALAPEIEALVG
ncbi:MAG: bifunctional oligoribonuclease/PAP phosphatase NrnA [Planctomycetota bacterium]